MEHLNILDYLVIIIYFCILIGIGIFLKKLASKSIEDYFLGGRKLPWWALGISGMAAWLDMTGTMIIVSFIFMLGPRGLFLEFRGGAGLVLIFMMIWIGKWHRRSGCMTNAEWMKFRFGEGPWGNFARISQVIAMVVFALGMLAYSIKGAGLFLSMFLPYSPRICAAIIMIITGVYLVQSGFYGVVVTDIFQSLCILVGVVFIIFYASVKVSGGDLASVAHSVTGNSDWMSIIPQWETKMPKGYEQYNFLLLISIFYLAKTCLTGTGIYVDGRYFGAAGDRECGLLGFMSGWTIMIRWPLMMGFAILGLYLINTTFPDQSAIVKSTNIIHQELGSFPETHWHDILSDISNSPDKYSQSMISDLSQTLGENWKDKVKLLNPQGTINPERILPAVLLFVIPKGIRGLLIVALLAAAMSTFNTFINTTAGYWTRDIYQNYFRPKASNRELIYSSWIFSLFLIVAGFIMAFYSKNINDIWGWLMGGLTAGLLIPWVLRWYWWRYNASGFAIGLIAGIVGAMLQRIFFPTMAEWWQFGLIFIIGLSASLIGTYVSSPTPNNILENFYIKTRPFGFWKKFEHLLPPQIKEEVKKEHLTDLLSVPFGLLWLVTLLLLPMLLMIRAWIPAAITAVLLIISLIGLYYFWYGNLPSPTPKGQER